MRDNLYQFTMSFSVCLAGYYFLHYIMDKVASLTTQGGLGLPRGSAPSARKEISSGKVLAKDLPLESWCSVRLGVSTERRLSCI